MVGWILKKILGSKNQRELKRLVPMVRRVNDFDEQFKSLSDEQLRAKTAIWKEELAKIPELEDQWKRLDEILPEAFAVVKNAARRLKDRQDSFTVCDQPMNWDMVHFDVQLLGGIVLHRGRIAEMATGEGKTLVATLPLYLNALTGRGVHLVTVNDYLARRDAEWMGRLYDFLGLTVRINTIRNRTCSSSAAMDDARDERVRVRLSPRQRHGSDPRAAGAARLLLRDCRWGRSSDRQRNAADVSGRGDLTGIVRQMETTHRAAFAQNILCNRMAGAKKNMRCGAWRPTYVQSVLANRATNSFCA
jgi:hypothetical protein